MKSDAHQMYASASRYSFSSWLRSVGEGWSQFWPVFVPVVSHLLDADFAISEFVNGLAMLGGDGFFSAQHFGNKGRRHINGSC